MKGKIIKVFITIGAIYMIIMIAPCCLVANTIENGLHDSIMQYFKFAKGIVKTIITGSN